MYRIGIDLGGTKTEGILLDNNLHQINRLRMPTRQEEGYSQVVETIVNITKKFVEQTGNDEYVFGIGTPGYTGNDGKIRNSSLQCINGNSLVMDLENELGITVYTVNDANCFALSEAIMGAGKGEEVVFGVILGTGCGGGLVVNGQVWKGPRFLGGEIGHTTLHPGGVPCFCGKRGCVERYISGTGVEEQHLERFGEQKALPDIVAAYREGDQQAKETMDAFFDDFGIAMANLMNMVDPGKIVLGGGVSNIKEVYTTGLERVKNHVFGHVDKVPVVKNENGDSAGVFGAALLGKKL